MERGSRIPQTPAPDPRSDGRVPKVAEAVGGRDNNFNLIRMIAASLVLVSHAVPIALGGEQPWAEALGGITLGMACVYAFFAISGYFIAQSFERSSSVWSFVKARLLRIYPGLIVMLLFTVLVLGPLLTTAPPAVYWPDAVSYLVHNASLFFMQYPLAGLFEGNPAGATVNASLWSLKFELQCYVGVLLAGVLGWLRRPALVAGLLAGLVLANLALLLVDMPYRLSKLIELGLPFAVGSALFVWRDRVPLDGRIVLAMAVAAAALRVTPLFQTAFILALSYGVFWLGGLRSDLLRRYNRFGDYSYGMYIYAHPVQQVVVLLGVTSPLGNILVAGPVTLVLAVLSWTLIEKPALALKDRRRRTPAPQEGHHTVTAPEEGTHTVTALQEGRQPAPAPLSPQMRGGSALRHSKPGQSKPGQSKLSLPEAGDGRA